MRAQKAEGWDLLKIHPGIKPEVYLGAKDAAYPVRLQPGNYTMIVRTKSAEPAELLAEAYVVP